MYAQWVLTYLVFELHVQSFKSFVFVWSDPFSADALVSEVMQKQSDSSPLKRCLYDLRTIKTVSSPFTSRGT